MRTQLRHVARGLPLREYVDHHVCRSEAGVVVPLRVVRQPIVAKLEPAGRIRPWYKRCHTGRPLVYADAFTAIVASSASRAENTRTITPAPRALTMLDPGGRIVRLSGSASMLSVPASIVAPTSGSRTSDSSGLLILRRMPPESTLDSATTKLAV